MKYFLAIGAIASLLANAAELPPAQTATAALGNSTPEAIEEVQISGERPGPRLWKVTHGDHTLYILATLTPLPRKMAWRSQDVERVLSQAQLLIPERPSVDIKAGPITAIRLYTQWRRTRGNPNGAKLAQVLPVELYARFDALRRRYAPRATELDERRPLLAAAELYQKAIEAVGLKLSNDIGETVVKLARKQRVPVADLEQKLDDPRAVLTDFGNIPAAAEQECLTATLSRLETDLDMMRSRATAWASGDVSVLRAQPAVEQEAACWGAMTSAPRIAALRTQFDSLWFDAAIRALEQNRTTLAVSPISRLLEPGGILAKLQARGYVVQTP